MALWPHQQDAVAAARKYLRAKNVDGESALITMPTGTGKTGVIAAISTSLPEVGGHRLVLTPWNALAVQLIDDLSGRFWSRLPPAARPDVLPVRRLPPSSELFDLQSTSPTIYVATTAAISKAARVAKERGADPGAMFEGFGCVLVDEGHYEPAQNWSAAIRSLKRRTVLLTATPYRNDRKYFHINGWRYRFSHADAEKQLFVRSPKFVELPDAIAPHVFAVKLIEAVNRAFDGAEETRVIVRCATAESITTMVRALRGLGQSVVGVHERFAAAADPDLVRVVPRPDQCDAQFWVHQNKLIEGIDDPRFKVLAFYEPITSGRAIIQQIGRVLRNPARDPNDMTAVVITHPGADIVRTWRTYRLFDTQPEADSVATLPSLVEKILGAQPIAFYYDGAFRRPIDLTAQQVWREFIFPLRTRVFRIVDQSLGLAALIDAISVDWQARDRVLFGPHWPDERTCVIAFVTTENSPLLRAAMFIEPQFGYTVVRVDGDLVYVHDTAGATPTVIADCCPPLTPPDLQSLFPKGYSQLVSVALLNTDVGRHVPRSRRMSAAAIDELAPDLADYAYVCTVAEGYTEVAHQRFRRYLGISNSRVTDYRTGHGHFAEYSAWLDELSAQLRASGPSTDTFARYAAYAPVPEDTRAKHILIDLNPSEFVQELTGVPLQIEDHAAAVNGDAFDIAVSGTTHKATVQWDGEHTRYHIECPTLADERYLRATGDSTQELLRYLNTEQRMRLVPAAGTSLYAHGSFYRPIIPSLRSGAFQLLDILTGLPELATARREKGTDIVDGDWDPQSVFGLISALSPASDRTAPQAMRALTDRPQMILCTDLGTEVADFVITTEQRIIFIHAKASLKGSVCSASALHDISAQAIKNLTHLQPLSVAPMDRSRWMRPWSAPPYVAGSTHRLRWGSFTSSQQMWTHMRAHITTPGIEREVWLVLGNALSRRHLQEQARKKPPAAEPVQVYALLQSTWGAVNQLGGRLRIFCSP
ncbi:DEAD/DEAH box helicase family protein [Mycobacteroides chelonae]